ncbi:MAG: symmetrical bis(5'-nucleosyl)-tetraphosphatase, partial [Proteobacteria bacterium]|nr:symmetrical bis(5'-nucleosyl)-tetraphosphatase [Pseudomonadota bacterium]
MATYAIGDLQGCYDPFRKLLDQIDFDPAKDRLWLTGDLVNRGPKSLQLVRFVRGLGDSVITVLGNHDLHLLALASDSTNLNRRFETLEKLLRAADCDELVDWLRRLPLAHYDRKLDTLLVHAGTHPAWSVKKTLAHAAEVEAALQGKKFEALLEKMYGNTPQRWSGKLKGNARLRFIVNTLTRMRMLTADMRLNFAHTGAPWRARRGWDPRPGRLNSPRCWRGGRAWTRTGFGPCWTRPTRLPDRTWAQPTLRIWSGNSTDCSTVPGVRLFAPRNRRC